MRHHPDQLLCDACPLLQVRCMCERMFGHLSARNIVATLKGSLCELGYCWGIYLVCECAEMQAAVICFHSAV
jgi:hypothetical protein